MTKLYRLFIVLVLFLFSPLYHPVLAQNTAPFESSQKARLYINNGIRSIKTYAYQTNLKDSLKTPEVLTSVCTIKRSKKQTTVKTISFHPLQPLKIIEEYEEQYNQDMRLVKEIDKTNDYTSTCTYHYNKNGLLMDEIDIWTLNYARYYDTTQYFYGENGKLIYSYMRNNSGDWARDSFYYEGENLVKKVHRIPPDPDSSITMREEFITEYFYPNNTLVKSSTTFYSTQDIRTDSMFYENGKLVKEIMWDCGSSKFCGSRLEFTFDKSGNTIKMASYTYPDATLIEFNELYDDRGLPVSATTINHGADKKFFRRHVYQ